ncbi:hypothetical protein BGW80DRAFT_1459816 [Lactifluus volemus]|nr:hypothetical protein BGW80DRAFT_1459816 [Lactifluus volemus]
MLFFKFSIALLAPLAALAVPVPSGTDASHGQSENTVTIPAQTRTMPLPPMTQRDLPSSACTDNALSFVQNTATPDAITGSISSVLNPLGVFADPVTFVSNTLGAFADPVTSVPNTDTLGATGDVVSSMPAPTSTSTISSGDPLIAGSGTHQDKLGIH